MYGKCDRQVIDSWTFHILLPCISILPCSLLSFSSLLLSWKTWLLNSKCTPLLMNHGSAACIICANICCVDVNSWVHFLSIKANKIWPFDPRLFPYLYVGTDVLLFILIRCTCFKNRKGHIYMSFCEDFPLITSTLLNYVSFFSVLCLTWHPHSHSIHFDVKSAQIVLFGYLKFDLHHFFAS